MEHTNAYQCLDSIRTRLEYLVTEVLKRDDANRQLEVRLSELQNASYICVYAEAENEIERLRKVVDNLHTQIADMITEKRKAKPKEASVHTTALFWDCNCPKNYINASYITKCEICGAHKADQPDSRLEELGMARLSGINDIAERYARSNK